MALGEESPAAVKTRHLWVSATFATGLLEMSQLETQKKPKWTLSSGFQQAKQIGPECQVS